MVKTFEQYINENLTSLVGRYKNQSGIRKEDELTEDKVRSFLQEDCIPDKITITIKDGKPIVNVDGDFWFDNDKVKGGHLPFQFGTVSGSFSCSHCNLTSLKGCPKSVGGHFSCGNNKLTSLEGCPAEVRKNFWANDNQKKFQEHEVERICHVTGKIYV